MDPLLVLLPGLDGTSILFGPVLEHLGDAAVTVEYPQTLPSSYASLLPTVLAALPTDRDFVLLGWSFSGPLALMAAAKDPPGLCGVVLCASFVRKPLPWVPKFARHFAWPFLFRMSASLAVAKTALAGLGNARVNQMIRAAHDAVPAKVMAARVREVLLVDVRRELVECSAPVLYLKASSDRIVPGRNAKAVRQLKPSVTIKEIPGPHIALALSPREAATEMVAFLGECEEASRGAS